MCINVCMCIYIYILHFSTTLTEVFQCFFLSCKAKAGVKLAKMGHGPHSSRLVVICVVLLLFVLFYVLFVFVWFCVLFVCKCVLYYCHRVLTQLKLANISYHHIISYHIISYHIISYHIISYHIICVCVWGGVRNRAEIFWCKSVYQPQWQTNKNVFKLNVSVLNLTFTCSCIAI